MLKSDDLLNLKIHLLIFNVLYQIPTVVVKYIYVKIPFLLVLMKMNEENEKRKRDSRN